MLAAGSRSRSPSKVSFAPVYSDRGAWANGRRRHGDIVREVVNIDEVRFPLRVPLLSRVLGVADQLPLLGVGRDERHAVVHALLRLGSDGLEQRVPVRMLTALDRSVRRLEAAQPGRLNL
jgi:hypothetical protein